MIESHAPSALRRWLLGGGCVVALLALVFWRPLEQRCLLHFLLRSDAPSPQVLTDAVEDAGNPRSVLERLWLTQRIPHRQFVLSYLGQTSPAKPELFRAMEPAVLAAAGDADVQARELALAVLVRMKHPALRRLALAQLANLDPAVRLLGMQSLRSIATANDVPIAMRLLGDTEPRVVVASAQVLRQATGLDFGIRSAQAMPQFTGIGTNPPPAPDLQAISQGVQRWRDWWNNHQAEYPTSPLTSPQRNPVAFFGTPDFSLEDSRGKPVHLSDYRGKVVMLVFWSLDTAANLDVLALKALQQRNPDRLAILGICIPEVPSCADEHEQGPEQAHHHESSTPAMDAGQMRAMIEETTRPLQLNYPMLIDGTGHIGFRFNVEDRPTYVLIDAQGMIRRCFVGSRTEPVLAAMVVEAGRSTTEPRQPESKHK